MDKFVFGLQTLLEHRQRLEADATRALGESQDAFNECSARLASMIARRENAASECERLREQGAEQLEIVFYLDYIECLKGQIEAQRNALRAAESALEDKRSALITARKETRAVELLRDRSRAAHEGALKMKEQKVSDEVASYVFNRGQRP